MQTNINSKIPTLSIDEMIDTLSKLYVNAIKRGISYKRIPGVFLWGTYGIGKSQGVKQIAEGITHKTGKRVNLIILSLPLYNPVDFRGVPFADQSREYSKWLKPKEFDLPGDDDVVNILFLDELNTANAGLLSCAYRIILDRVIGDTPLPDNTFVLAAGNRTKDNSIAYVLPKALCNRLLHFECITDVNGWKKWAVKSGAIHPFVLGFIEFNSTKLYDYEANDDPEKKAFATPRSWEMVSEILKDFNESDYCSDEVYHLISAAIGKGMGIEFMAYVKLNHKLPSMKDIFDGKCPGYPKKQDQIYALISGMIDYTKDHHSFEELKNALKYISVFPKDYQTLYFMNTIKISEEIKNRLLDIPYFYEFLENNDLFAG